jgi:hypothetical protein
LFGTTVALAFALVTIGKAQHGNGHGNNAQPALQDAVVAFAQLVTPGPGPGTLAGTLTHFLNPDDVTILKGGTVTFVINNGGHGVAIYPVHRNTTREDIAEDLCQGPPGSPESDRAARFPLCGGTTATAGTANLNYDITDSKGDLIIRTGVNTTASPHPRVDDPTNRLLATSGAVPACGPGQSEPVCDSSVFGTNLAGGFLAGSVIAIPTATPPVAAAVGNRIVYRFNKTGRYLVICMNRAHLLNDHMFGFVDVVGGDGDDQ